MALEHEFHFRLDNAAKIFPALLSPRQTTVFRVSAEIDAPVNVRLLSEALGTMMVRCPYYHVELRRGLFWYYLEPSGTEPRVEAESRYPCLYIPYKHRGVLPFRVLAFRNRIIFETAHFLTDGGGALRFLNGLVLEYLRRRGERIDLREGEGTHNTGGSTEDRSVLAHRGIIDCTEPMDQGEAEDGFARFYERGIPKAESIPPALQLRGTPVQPPVFYVTEGTIPGDTLKAKAAEYGVTIGVFFTALLIDVCREEMEEHGWKHRPIRVSLPIDLRRFFPSITMRNFALAVEPGIDPRLGRYTFEEILAAVHAFMQAELDSRMILKQFARNVEGERKPLIRATPSIFKDLMLRNFYANFGRKVFTVSFSNLGRVAVPEPMRPFIRGYSFLPPPQKATVSATSCAYGGYTRFFITSTMEERIPERRFFARIRAMGIRVRIATNRR